MKKQASMMDKFKEILPGQIITLVISLVTTLVVFAGTFSSLRAEVNNNTELIKKKVDETEYKALLNGQERMNVNFEKRFDRLEQKIDRLNERAIR